MGRGLLCCCEYMLPRKLSDQLISRLISRILAMYNEDYPLKMPLVVSRGRDARTGRNRRARYRPLRP